MCQLCDASVLLLDYVQKGVVWKEDGAYVGRASDGQIVQIGHNAVSARDYLLSNPKPEDW